MVYPLGLWSRSSGVVKVLYDMASKLFTFTFTFNFTVVRCNVMVCKRLHGGSDPTVTHPRGL